MIDDDTCSAYYRKLSIKNERYIGAKILHKQINITISDSAKFVVENIKFKKN